MARNISFSKKIFSNNQNDNFDLISKYYYEFNTEYEINVKAGILYGIGLLIII